MIFRRKPKPPKVSDEIKKTVSFPPAEEENRRATRINLPHVRVSLTIQNQPMAVREVSNMSTLGIAVRISQKPPQRAIAHFVFEQPAILNQLKISAHIRRIRELSPDLYEMGCEFIFSDQAQQNQLLKWLMIQLEDTPGFAEGNLGVQREETEARTAPLPGGMTVHFPHDSEEWEQSMQLLSTVNVHHALLQTKIFVLLCDKTALAAVPFFSDTFPFRLQADRLFAGEIDSFRDKYRRIGEISAPSFRNDLLADGGAGLSHLRKLSLLQLIMPHLLVYATQFASLTDLIAVVPLQLREFFQMWLFEALRVSHGWRKIRKADPGERGNKCYLMRLDLTSLRERYQQKRPEIAKLFMAAESAKALESFQDSYYPDSATLKKWFITRHQILGSLNQEQKGYFHFLAPDLFSL